MGYPAPFTAQWIAQLLKPVRSMRYIGGNVGKFEEFQHSRLQGNLSTPDSRLNAALAN